MAAKERCLANKVEDMATIANPATIALKPVLLSDIIKRLLISRGVIGCEIAKLVLKAILRYNIAHRFSNSEACIASFLSRQR